MVVRCLVLDSSKDGFRLSGSFHLRRGWRRSETQSDTLSRERFAGLVDAARQCSELRAARKRYKLILRTRTGRYSCTPSMKPKKKSAFDAEVFLESVGASRRVAKFQRNETVFSQGEAADSVMYIQRGGVKFTVMNESGKEAVVAMFGPGDFFGEGSMTGQAIRMGTATAIVPTTVLVIEKGEMIRVLHAEHEMSDRFIAHMLARNIRVEADLTNQLFDSTEKRLARALLVLARYGKQDQPQKMLPKVSQKMLAEMIGTTRSHVNVFMNKFRKLGFIEYNGGIKVNKSLLSVVLHE